MSGKRLASYRAGDRSEYLATYVFSRFSYVIPLPRQEDFGVVDFLCVLANEEKHLVFPEIAFYVQVKSNEDNITFDKDATRWISSHMDLPLILCIINKKESRVKLFTCWNIWSGLFVKHLPNILVLQLNTDLPLESADIDRNTGTVTIPIGPPILNSTVDEIEQNPSLFYRILKTWLEVDKQNIARRSVGRIFVSGYVEWNENEPPEAQGRVRNHFTYGPEYQKAEGDIAPILTALAHNYRENKKEEKLNAVTNMLRQLRPYLDPHGTRFANGELTIED